MNLYHVKAKGFTISEVMIAMTIGILMTGILVSIFGNNKKAYSSNSRLIESSAAVRFAFATIKEDLFNVGFYGTLSRTHDIASNNSKLTNNRCTSTIVKDKDSGSAEKLVVNLATDLRYPILGGKMNGDEHVPDCLYLDSNDQPVPNYTTAESDFLVIKGTRGTSVLDGELDANSLYIRTGPSNGEFVADGVSSAVSKATNSNWRYYSHIYYVSRNRLLRERYWFNPDDDEAQWIREVLIGPCLPETAGCNAEEQHTGTGVESLQVTFGIDNSPLDGIADYYTDELDIKELNRLVEVKLFLILRSAAGKFTAEKSKKRIYFDDHELYGLSASINFTDNYSRELFGTSAVVRNQWYKTLFDPDDDL